MHGLHYRVVCLLVPLLFGSFTHSQGTFTLSGVVTGPDGPVANAMVRLSNPAGLQTTTDATGRFNIQVPAGQVNLGIIPPTGSGLAEEMVSQIEVTQNLFGRFTLNRLVTIAGRVAWPAGAANPRVSLYSLTTKRTYEVQGVGVGSFSLQVAADFYSIHASTGGRDLYFARVNVDARNGDVSNLSLSPSLGEEPILTTAPPQASRISVSQPNQNGVATVSGAPGAVQGLSSVLVANLLTQQINLTVSQPDGSFTAQMFAPPGSPIQIKHDPTGRYLPRLNFVGTLNEVAAPPGTIIYVHPTPATDGAVSFGTCSIFNPLLISKGDLQGFGVFGAGDPGSWAASGTLGRLQWSPGEVLTVRGKVVVYSKNVTAATDLSLVRLFGRTSLERIFDEGGLQLQASRLFMSSVMTPTGLPIEVSQGNAIFVPTAWNIGPTRLAGENRLEADWSVELRLPTDLPIGFYRPRLSFNVVGISAQNRYFDIFPAIEGGNNRNGRTYVPMLRIGSPKPPRLFWALGLNHFSNGSRGSIALEDRGRFQLASRVITSTDTFVIPMKDERTGRALRYRIEPFVPIITNSIARLTDAPQISFRLPSGSLRVKVIKPDGTTDDLGTAPFVQSLSRTPISRAGAFPSNASASVSDLYELTTLDPRFEYAFTQTGLHQVVMTGTVEDVWGNVYDGGGTYEVFVGKTLDLETGVMPGTPFEAGDVFSPAVIVQPGVPADVEVKFKLLANSDPGKAAERVIRGRANRFGYFNPSFAEPILLGAPGEYRVDITARYVDEQGVHWTGAVSWGSIVETPGSAVVTHGRRGFDNVNTIQAQWLRVRAARAGGDHLMFPFHRGDVMWMAKDDSAANIPKISLQDSQGDLAQRVRSLINKADGFEPPSLEERIAAGEIPLFSTTSTGRSPSAEPEAIDQWGYFYGFSERPGVHVREFVSEDVSSFGYWRFLDNYHFQLSNGAIGDLPNDFKFQFGGAVFRDLKDNFSYYGAYASLFVLLPFQDAEGGRIFPPFQGAAGGPSGGPIMKLKGKDIDIFFHPTGTRPGSILEVGNLVSFAGQVGPTLPSKLSINVTWPSGRTREITGQANKVGYFYKPEQNFVADEAGPYKVRVRVWHDGATSAGTVQSPFPTGDVLGSNQGEFYFYAVTPSSAEPSLNVPRQSLVRPAEQPINISLNPSNQLSNRRLFYTTVMPGFILEEGTSSALTYNYDAVRLSSDFPNLDLFNEGFAGADTVTMSFLITGTDAGGRPVYEARQALLQGEELLSLKPVTAPAGTLASVSAASYSGATLARESIVAAFGAGLVNATPVASEIPLPTFLNGTTVTVRDSAGAEREAPVFFVSPGQVNYQMPPGTMAGPATVTVTNGDLSISAGGVQIASVAPGLFAANANGEGVAAALALRVKADGSQSYEPISRFDPAQNRFVSLPIDLGPATDQVFLILFGTGMRFRSSLSTVTARLGGVDAPVLFVGAQGDFVGLDQINLQIPRSLVGRGEVEIRLTADGQQANAVMISVK